MAGAAARGGARAYAGGRVGTRRNARGRTSVGLFEEGLVQKALRRGEGGQLCADLDEAPQRADALFVDRFRQRAFALSATLRIKLPYQTTIMAYHTSAQRIKNRPNTSMIPGNGEHWLPPGVHARLRASCDSHALSCVVVGPQSCAGLGRASRVVYWRPEGSLGGKN